MIPITSSPNGFRMSSYLQDILCYLGSDYVFDEASRTLDKLLHLQVSAKQIERVSEKVGQVLENHHQDNAVLPSTLLNSQEVYTYVQLDGSMVFTREEGWKETKLGRVFQLPIDEVLQQDTQVKIAHSESTGYLGASDTFLSRFSKQIPFVECPIFIADGAPCIWPPWNEIGLKNNILIQFKY